MTHVVLAPDKFKGSLTARQAADALARGIASVRPDLALRRVPVADGGDGTVAAALAAGFAPVEATVSGPTGEPVRAAFALRDGVAVVEAAAACGLALLPGGTPAPLAASSTGVGELLTAAARAGAHTIVLGVGGTACTDGGAGLLTALGARLTSGDGTPLPQGGGALLDLAVADLSTVEELGAGLVLAADVDNPLCGPEGAAAVFGPQKGVAPAEVAALDAGLRHLADLIDPASADLPGAGAGGGIGYAALVLGAVRRPGIELLLELVGFAGQLDGAVLVVTGEGSLDEQSLRGKAPIGVIGAAAKAGVPAVAVAGRSTLDAEQLAGARIAAAYALTDLEPDPAVCVAEAAPLLERLGERVARDWLVAT